MPKATTDVTGAPFAPNSFPFRIESENSSIFSKVSLISGIIFLPSTRIFESLGARSAV